MSKLPQAKSVGEEEFWLHCRAYNLAPEREYAFAEGRKWRADFAWPHHKILVEIEGGTEFGKSRHSTGTGFENDARKYNEAALGEWLVFRFTTAMVTSGEAIDFIRKALA